VEVSSGGPNWKQPECGRVGENSNSIDVGVLVGPWKRIAAPEVGKPFTLGNVSYLIDRPNGFGQNSFLVHFRQTGIVNNDVCLTATNAPGEEGMGGSVYEIAIGRDSRSRTVEEQPNFHGIPLKSVKEFRLNQRKRQWITFSNFAPNPKTAPPAAPTSAPAIP
jgi:hypothetical protein